MITELPFKFKSEVLLELKFFVFISKTEYVLFQEVHVRTI